jgi:hypothetical protein
MDAELATGPTMADSSPVSVRHGKRILLCLMLRDAFDERVAGIACLLAALSPFLARYAAHVRTESPYLFFSTLALWLLAQGIHQKSPWPVFLRRPRCRFRLSRAFGSRRLVGRYPGFSSVSENRAKGAELDRHQQVFGPATNRVFAFRLAVYRVFKHRHGAVGRP